MSKSKRDGIEWVDRSSQGPGVRARLLVEYSDAGVMPATESDLVAAGFFRRTVADACPSAPTDDDEPEIEPHDSWAATHQDAHEVLRLSHDWPGKRGLSLRAALARYPEASKEALRRMRAIAAHYLEEMRELVERDDYSELKHHAGHVESEMLGVERIIKAHWANLQGKPDTDA